MTMSRVTSLRGLAPYLADVKVPAFSVKMNSTGAVNPSLGGKYRFKDGLKYFKFLNRYLITYLKGFSTVE
jgi:hypothetical protein